LSFRASLETQILYRIKEDLGFVRLVWIVDRNHSSYQGNTNLLTIPILIHSGHWFRKEPNGASGEMN
jgi:hypothetical protein